jgi:hypothetical protein
MDNYSFTIRFDNEDHSLSAINGLPINQLGEMLILLGKAVKSGKDDNLTLSEVKGNCYAIVLNTSNSVIYHSANEIHKKISEKNFSGFNPDQNRYAEKLKSIIGTYNYKMNVYSENKDFDCEISDIEFENKVESYFEIDDVHGIIVSIGSSNLESNSYVKLSKEGYEISITNEQESELIKHFKKEKLLLRIRKKINFETKKTEAAELIDFEVMGNKKNTFINNAEEIMTKHQKKGLFSNITNSAATVRNLRGNININKNGQ